MLCGVEVAQHACRRLSGKDEDAWVVALMDRLQINNELMAQVLEALGLASGDDSWINCALLCQRALLHCNQRGTCHVPQTQRSDEACFVYGETRIVECGLDVRPQTLVQELASAARTHYPDTGVKTAESGVQPVEIESMNNFTDPMFYGPNAVIDRILNMFRIFPAFDINSPVLVPGMNETALRSVARVQATASALVSTVLDAMPANEEDPALAEWFSGSPLPFADVKRRVARVLNFVSHSLERGFVFVYPAQSAKFANECGENPDALGFVARNAVSGEPLPTKGPVCSNAEEALTKPCGMDVSRQFFVYLCGDWGEASEDASRIEALFHFALHHAGLLDYTYGVQGETQMQSHKECLGNAANYQSYAFALLSKEKWG